MNVQQTAEQILEIAAKGGADGPKFIAEVAVVVRALQRSGALDDDAARTLANQVRPLLHQPHQLALGDSPAQWAVHLLPYAALRHLMAPSAYYDNMLEIFSQERLHARERLPYRDSEEVYLLHLANMAPRPSFGAAWWYDELLQCWDFGSNNGYVVTHRYFYATDFGANPLRETPVKAALLVLLGKASLWGKVDLLFEVATCLLAEEPSTEELALVDELLDAHRADYEVVVACDNIADKYHDVFTHALCQAARAQHGLTKSAGVSLAAPLRQLCIALASKSPVHIRARWATLTALLPAAAALRPVVDARLALLQVLAEQSVLFERECALLGRSGATVDYADVTRGCREAIQAMQPI